MPNGEWNDEDGWRVGAMIHSWRNWPATKYAVVRKWTTEKTEQQGGNSCCWVNGSLRSTTRAGCWAVATATQQSERRSVWKLIKRNRQTAAAVRKKKKKDEIMTCKSVTVGAPYPVTKKTESNDEGERTNEPTSVPWYNDTGSSSSGSKCCTYCFLFFFFSFFNKLL